MRPGVVVLFCLASAPANADSGELAMRRFNRAIAAWDVADYGDSLDALKKAYAQNPDNTVLLRYIGRVHRKLGERAALLLQPSEAMARYADASDAYRHYLDRTPGAKDRKEVEAEIGALDEKIASIRKEQEARMAKPPIPAAEPVKAATEEKDRKRPEEAERQRKLDSELKEVAVQQRRGTGEIAGGTGGAVLGGVLTAVGVLSAQNVDEDYRYPRGGALRSALTAIGGTLLLTVGAAIIVDGVRRILDPAGASRGKRPLPPGAFLEF